MNNLFFWYIFTYIVHTLISLTCHPSLRILDSSLNFVRPDHVVADFGCGDAKIAQAVSNKVHSFDLVALNEYVTPCDMADVSELLGKNN